MSRSRRIDHFSFSVPLTMLVWLVSFGLQGDGRCLHQPLLPLSALQDLSWLAGSEPSSTSPPLPLPPLSLSPNFTSLLPSVFQYHCINLTPSLAYFAPILSLLEKKTLDIPIEGVFPFTPRGVEDAFKTLDGGRARGKVVVGVKGFKERVE